MGAERIGKLFRAPGNKTEKEYLNNDEASGYYKMVTKKGWNTGLMVASAVSFVTSIGLMVKFERDFGKGLKMYDQDLRKKYQIIEWREPRKYNRVSGTE